MRSAQPTLITILGGGGDLAQRKLFPALFDLYAKNLLPENFRIVGLARTERTNEEYQSLVKDALRRSSSKYDGVTLDSFCTHIQYASGSFDTKESYKKLLAIAHTFEEETKSKANRLFYLAVPPVHYASIFTYLHESTLATAHKATEQWSRILIEKPFGSSYNGALELDQALQGLFMEDQIFRIDHYLAKEAVQNILSFRFANTLLRSAWSNEHIKDVTITMDESINVQDRGAFYDKVGALSDVGQNHLLQILALIAMDEPHTFTAHDVRSSRKEILEKLIPMNKTTVGEGVVRAQYDGYRSTKGVDEHSNTETYFEFIAYLDTDTWRGVPFLIKAGKALKNDKVSVEINFKEVGDGAFKTKGNSIILTVSPVQSMNITLNVKKPGHGFSIEENTLSFAWDEDNRGIVNAYEKVLLDCIEGDQTLFTMTGEVLASWKFIASITDHWDRVPLQTYIEGSDGPTHNVSLHTHTHTI